MLKYGKAHLLRMKYVSRSLDKYGVRLEPFVNAQQFIEKNAQSTLSR